MANDYDRIFKENLDPLLPYIARRFLGFTEGRLEEAKEKFQKTITLERELDFTKIVRMPFSEDDHGLHIEIHVSNEDLRYRQMLYAALFMNHYKLPLRQMVVYIGDDKATHISKNHLKAPNLDFRFIFLDMKSLSADQFVQSKIPEEIILSILCDFGKKKPADYIRLILHNLTKVVKNTSAIEKYQNQLHVLSRLRKLQAITLTEIRNMPLTFDKSTDTLYLEGIEKGIEKGEQIGQEKLRNDYIVKLHLHNFNAEQISSFLSLEVGLVQSVISDFLKNQKPKTKRRKK